MGLGLGLGLGFALQAQPSFYLPTANRALFERGGEPRFFVGTAGKPWTSGGFGCVRSGGAQFHEGIDVRSIQRDSKGEPTDPVRATAAGQVAYRSDQPSLSNYGRYLILRHRIDGIEVYSLYAHLREIRADLRPGMAVGAGEVVGVLGRSANTRQAISKDRAHVHFELNLRVSDRFAAWRKARDPGLRNDHGEWNGQNFLGLDPVEIFRAQASQGTNFNLARFIKSRPELCRVVVRSPSLGWTKRYPLLLEPNPKTAGAPVAGYELALDYVGIPIRAIPRTAAELKNPARFHLVSVNESEWRVRGCRKIVLQREGRWQLGRTGERLLDLLAY